MALHPADRRIAAGELGSGTGRCGCVTKDGQFARKRAREGESKRGRGQESKRGREQESKRGREQERERGREGESKRGREKEREREGEGEREGGKRERERLAIPDKETKCGEEEEECAVWEENKLILSREQTYFVLFLRVTLRLLGTLRKEREREGGREREREN